MTTDWKDRSVEERVEYLLAGLAQLNDPVRAAEIAAEGYDVDEQRAWYEAELEKLAPSVG